MKLRPKILLLIFCGGLFIWGVSGVFSYTYLNQEMVAHIENDVGRQLTFLDFALTNFLIEAENDIRILAANQQVSTQADEAFTNFLEADEATFEYHYTETELAIIKVLNDFRINHPYVNSVYMGRENGSFVRSHPRTAPTQYDPRVRPWYTLAKANPGQVMRTDPYKSVTTDDINIGIVTALVDENEQVYGVIGADITLVNLTDYIANFDLGYSGQLLLLDEHGTILASQDADLLIGDVHNLLGSVAHEVMNQNQGMVVYEDSSKIYFITSPALDWKLAAIIPNIIINWEIQNSLIIPLISGISGLILLMGMIAFGATTFIIKPLESLNKATKKIAQTGELSQLGPSPYKGEFDSLWNSFNQMVSALVNKDTELRTSELKFRTVTESNPAAIFIVQDECFVFVNPSAESLTGFHTEELIGMYYLQPVHPDYRKMVAKNARNRLAGLPVPDRYEIKYVTKSGENKWLDFSPRIVNYGGVPSIMATGIDITERKRAEDSLRESEETARVLLKAPTEVIVLTDPHGNIIDTNEQMAQKIGRPVDELIGQNVWDLFESDVVKRRKAYADQVLLSGEPVRFEDERQGIWFDNSVYPVFDEQGKAIKIAVISRDISQRKQAEDKLRKLNLELEKLVQERTIELQTSEARYRSVVEDQTEYINRWKPDGTLTFVNDSYAKLCQIPKEELIGQSLFHLIPKENVKKIKQLVKGITPEDPVIGNEFFTHDDNYSVRWFYWSWRGFFDKQGNLIEFQSVGRDITKRKQAEEELNLAKQTAEIANQAKTEFLSRMSHELRTPMNSILGFAQLLEISQKDPLTDGQRDRVQQIVDGGNHLLNLINEILDISRIEADRLQVYPEPVRVLNALQEVYELAIPLAEPRDIQIELQVPDGKLYILADQQRLKQVLLNLLSNAVKYNPRGGKVSIHTELQSNDYLRISITDTGMGISAKKLEKLFVPFERLEADTSGVEGTGLGLTLSKRLVELMGGQIGVESKVGVGSTFWFELPFSNDPVVTSLVAEKSTGPLTSLKDTSMKILYIEDNPANYELVRQVLDEYPQIELIGETHAQAGIETARQQQPDLILLDLHLPGIDGGQALGLLKLEKEIQSIPVVVVSADATPKRIQRLIDQGAEAYLTKPLNIKEFIRLIDKHIKGKSNEPDTL